MDKINKINGSETIVLGAQQYTKGKGEKVAIERETTEAFRVATECGCGLTKGSESPLTTEASDARISSAEREQARLKVKAEVFANAIKHDHKSKNPTTRWNDIIKLK